MYIKGVFLCAEVALVLAQTYAFVFRGEGLNGGTDITVDTCFSTYMYSGATSGDNVFVGRLKIRVERYSEDEMTAFSEFDTPENAVPKSLVHRCMTIRACPTRYSLQV